jgi:bifunctional non-homologous end joining protein LigD
MPAKLATYRRKRDFKRTPEPSGSARLRSRGNSFVVQKHAARRLHYDFRLELDGVLKSWAVPKGPSLEPGEKRLAVQTEDHPLEYGRFHGVIPEGEYGAGKVELWDRGVWSPDGDAREGLARGRLKFRLQGKKLRGGWALVRMGARNGSRNGKENWLLIKERDEAGRARAAEPPAPGEVARERLAAPRGKRHPAPEEVTGARKSALPEFIAPQLATLVGRAPAGESWLHEIKLDGYRILARVERGRARLLTRNGKDWSARFPRVAAAAARLETDRALLDGEIVALDEHGVSKFQKLQEALSRGRSEHLVYFVFDLLHLDGRDLRPLPQSERKALVARLLGSARAPIRYSEHVEGQGAAFFDRACEMGLEGIVSKQKEAPYRSGRGTAWLKVKCVSSQEFVIAGYTDPKGARAGFGALLLGVHDKAGGLTYAGRVGTGFDERSLKGLLAKLKALEQPKSPFSKLPASAVTRDVHWVKPSLVADVAFTNWTRDGILRHPTFHGLREDKPAGEVVREQPKAPAPVESPPPKHRSGRVARTEGSGGGATIAGVTLTHPDRVLYPSQGITKRDLAAFYEEIADWILPHIVERPLSLLRCPEGQGKTCFYQKHAGAGAPEALKGVTVREKGAVRTYLYVEDLAGLISLVQMGVLELHPWGSRVGDLEHPDRLTFDLDPAPGLPWKRVVDAARQLHSLLAELGLTAFVKTTGGKGLHVVVPLAPKQPWESVKGFARAVAEAMARHSPSEYTASLSKANRKGKIFIDYLRNSQGATAVAAYSTRALAGAPVATPISWDELGADLRSDRYTVENLPRRLASLKKDPWEGFLKSRQTIPSAARIKSGKRRAADE